MTAETANQKLQTSSIEEEWICPVTADIMSDPYVLSSGQTIEKAALDKILQYAKEEGKTPCCPVTRAPITSFTPNISLKNTINKYLEDHPELKEKQYVYPKKDSSQENAQPISNNNNNNTLILQPPVANTAVPIIVLTQQPNNLVTLFTLSTASSSSHSPAAIPNLNMASNNNKSYDYNFKLSMLGDSGVGKSCMVLRYADDTYTEQYIGTLRDEFKIKYVDLNDKKIKLQIWNNKGSRTDNKPYQGVHGALILFDITDKSSFKKRVPQELNKLDQHASANILKILVGTKSDLDSKRIVPYATAKELADKHNMPYFEVSSKNGTNIKEAFEKLAKCILHFQMQENIKSKLGNISIEQASQHVKNIESILSKINAKKDDLLSKNKKISDKIWQAPRGATRKEKENKAKNYLDASNEITNIYSSILNLVSDYKKYKISSVDFASQCIANISSNRDAVDQPRTWAARFLNPKKILHRPTESAELLNQLLQELSTLKERADPQAVVSNNNNSHNNLNRNN
jgi:Ras-related protein Rab-1A